MFALFSLVIALRLALSAASPEDPCAAISGKKWVSPQQARSCLGSFSVDKDIKDNIIQVINKTLPFHTSVNYQILAPPPFEYVHEDIVADLARIQETSYPSDFDLHLDLYRSFRRLNDGHCVILNLCYDSLYISYLPTPLVLLTSEDGSQNVHIAPEAFTVASAEFAEQIEFWQDSLPGDLKGQLASLSGAKVLKINGQDPFIAVNENAEVTGSYQAFGTRQNSFFSSYSRGAKGWTYIMGNFAQQIHPLSDFVELTIQRVNSSVLDQLTIPYRSRIGSTVRNFTDSASYRSSMCTNVTGTNGFNVYDLGSVHAQQQIVPPVAYLEQQPMISYQDRKHPINVMLDATPLSDVDLPEELLPLPVPLNESYSVAQFYLLNDNITGVLALGSFSAANFTAFMGSLLNGLQELKSLGANRLIIDVTNNGGGYICIAHWLHRILIGPKNTTEPQAGLYTCTRAGSLAQLIVENINKGGDPEELLSYNPLQWTNSSDNLPFSVESHWLRPTVNRTINGHEDAFSPRLGAECQPFEMTPPEEGLFSPENIVIVSNGRCGSSCSLFSITMSKHEGVKTVVVGGHKGTAQQYCGIVGGQSTHFAEIDTEIKSTYLKNHTLAPPDFVLGITWRLAFGIDNPNEPEEWQDHPADFNLPLTMNMRVRFLHALALI
ncbi:hypothetical protein DFH08DRAFT_914726 [Mycena albidolilacea]|uniref:Tail specific protease domain-containing protein n=1 Tax=Mycena albidolilacea TaxID=1033008 RepID=A0AAD7ERG6_9AGAR|nr:hypothetical protein DFH08DRAFT_914726 [Mycena albidolilacea]